MGVIGLEQELDSFSNLNLPLVGDVVLVKGTTEWEGDSGLDDLPVSLHRYRLPESQRPHRWR